MNFPDNILWGKIRSGEISAFEEIFKKYYSRLCNYAYEILKTDELAEEAVQETLIRIWENRSKLDIAHSLKAYLFRSVHNQCLNMILQLKAEKKRHEKYAEHLAVDLDALMINGPYSESNPYLYEEMEKDILDALESLPEQCRKIFRMSRYDRLSYQEIANELNISINTVKTQLRRGMEKIKASLEQTANKQNTAPID